MFKYFFLGMCVFCGGFVSLSYTDDRDYAREDAQRQEREREYRREDWQRQERQREYTDEDVERRRVEDEQNQRTEEQYQRRQSREGESYIKLDI